MQSEKAGVHMSAPTDLQMYKTTLNKISNHIDAQIVLKQ